MSLRKLVEGDCGSANPLMKLGNQFTHDAARQDEGFGRSMQFGMHPERDMVNEFLGQMAAPPNTFQMGELLQEMRDIEHSNFAHFQQAPRVIDEVTSGNWAKELNSLPQQPLLPHSQQMVHVRPMTQQMSHVREFFDDEVGAVGSSALMKPMGNYQMNNFPTMAICPPMPTQVPLTNQFFDEETAMGEVEKPMEQASTEDWLNDYQSNIESHEKAAANYNENFWQRLQDEWQKLSETDHPWLSDLDDSVYDTYKEYKFVEENPMAELENAFALGKEYLAKGDRPSAALCFEVAVKKEPENAEIWELLGTTQAENEMDPQSIAALNRALQLNPGNLNVLMALAVCYTNETLSSRALDMLNNWLQLNPKYQHLVNRQGSNNDNSMASSIINGNKLKETQNLFLSAVRDNVNVIDSDVQQALGILYNLSNDYDKAVDCFRAAVTVEPGNAKIWNRLGASLANGTRSVEAVEAYQNALQLEPGFIRVRYNVGVCCMNLKAYKQAAEHLLTALNMQSNADVQKESISREVHVGQDRMSSSIWSTLKMVISLMGRNDLQEFVQNKDLQSLNKAFQE